MSTIAQQFGMQEALAQLGVKAINEGTSTGNEWFSNGELIESYSTKEYGVNADANFSSGRLQIKAANKQVFLFNTKGEYTLISKM